ncbi:MAG: hypothetical protein AAFU85_33765 [Planctomycetota bacterium]
MQFQTTKLDDSPDTELASVDGKRVWMLGAQAFHDVAFSQHAGCCFAVNGSDEILRQPLDPLGAREFVCEGAAIATSPDGKQLACSVAQTLNILDLTTQSTLRYDCGLSDHRYIHLIRFSADGSAIAAAHCDMLDRDGGFATLWDTATGEKRAHWELDMGSMIFDLVFADSGTSPFVAVYDDPNHPDSSVGYAQVRLFDIIARNEVARVNLSQSEGASCCLISNNLEYLLLGHRGFSSATELVHIATGRRVVRFSGATGVTAALAFSFDSQLAAFCSVKDDHHQSVISVHECKTGRRTAIWPIEGEVWYPEFSPCGKMLVTSESPFSGNGAALWNVLSGERLAALPHHCGYAGFSPDGNWLVSSAAITKILAASPIDL